MTVMRMMMWCKFHIIIIYQLIFILWRVVTLSHQFAAHSLISIPGRVLETATRDRRVYIHIYASVSVCVCLSLYVSV